MKLRALFLLAGILAVSGCSSQASSAAPTATHTSSQAPTPTRPAATPTHATAAPTRATTRATAPHITAVVAARTGSASPYDAGERALKAGHYAAAATDFRAAIDRHQRIADSYIGLGTAEIGLAQYAKALDAFRHALGLEPRNTTVVYDAAYAALNADLYHDAVAYATQYIKMKPTDGRGYHLRFLAYGGLLDPKHQLSDARLVVRYEPNSPTAYNDLGIALAQNKKYAASEAALTKAIALQPNNWEFYKNRGLAEYNLGLNEHNNHQLTLALKDFQRAEALVKDPTQRSNLQAAIAYLQKQMHH
jgi:tetratricopeptide (TPR) repeat protein